MLQRRANVEAAVTGLTAALVVFFLGWVAVRFVLLALVAFVGTTPFAAGGLRETAVLLAAAASIGGWLGGWWAAEQRQEPIYLDAFADTSLRTTEGDVLLTAGHRACDWLQRKRWGTPPDGPEDIVHIGDWNYSPTTASHSTQRLLASYASEVGSRDLRATSTDERLLILAAEPAWHRLCPASQWIRRPAGFSGGD